MVKETKKQLEGWQNKRLSWFGRIMALKMKVLPHLLFIFRALIISVPQKMLIEIQNMFDKFAWNGKKPRIGNAVLQQTRRCRGLASSNIL